MKLYIVCMLFITQLFAAPTVKVELAPQDPVAGEPFNIIFKVSSKKGHNPIINFDPQGFEVLSREETGTSTQTTYINGNLTVKREITINYEAIAAKTGFGYLKNISVDIANDNIKHKTVRFRVLKEQKRESDIFVRAEVDKSEVFVNESIIVRYYLYNRVRVLSMDIKKFPVLDKFLKRFHQESTGTQRVQLNNGIYERRIIYSAQLYSNKVGISKIDPISLSVAYASGRKGSNPFSNFGFGSMRSKKRSLQSKRLEIKVKALPNDPPVGFTGLVGDYKVQFKINKAKFLVNEPIEMSLSIDGPGALELYEEPKVFESSKVEEFDSTSDFVVNKNFTGTKSFKMTYLAREAGNIEAKRIPLVFFDANTLKFVTKYIDIPQITIAGTSLAKNDIKPPTSTDSEERSTPQVAVKVAKKINLNPIFSLKNTLVYNKLSVLFIFLALLCMYLFYKVFLILKSSQKHVELDIYQQVEKAGASYADFFELIQGLGAESSLKEKILSSKLDKEQQKNLLEKLDTLDSAYKKGERLVVKVPKNLIKQIKKQSKKYE